MDAIYGRIYCVTNTRDGKKYVGQTTRSLSARWVEHCSRFSCCRALYEAILVDGPDAFTIKQVAKADSRLELDAIETEWIARLNTVAPHGYNLRTGGGSNGTFSEETKARCRAIQNARLSDPDYRLNVVSGFRRMLNSPEAMRKRAAAVRIAAALPENREKERQGKLASWAGNDKRRQEASERALGRSKNPEYMERWMAACEATTRSPEKKQKNRDVMNSQWADPSFREKVKIARQAPAVKAERSRIAKALWADPEWKARRMETVRANIRKKRDTFSSIIDASSGRR